MVVYPMRHQIFHVLLICVLLAHGCAPNPSSSAEDAATEIPTKRTPLVVFCAGSLIIPFDEIVKAFEEKYPQIDVQNECHGSIQVIRHVTDIHEEIDVVATADHALIPMLMYDTNNPESGLPYASWYIRFATNQLALTYTERSKYADEINAQNWIDILARPDVRIGLSDPRFDASGYRTLMIFALAEDYFDQKKLFSGMFNDQFTAPVTLFYDDDSTLITVPEVLETRAESNIVLRGASIQLIALLQSGDLDYAFEYVSVAKQHNLSMVILPDALNMSSEEYIPDYSRVRVLLDFQRFARIKPEFSGERIGYGITIPSNALHPEEAATFIAFLLEQEGRKIMEENFHPLFNPPVANHYENLPPSLQTLCIPDPDQ